MKEIELISSIDEHDFYKKIEEFTEKYSQPKKQVRLGFVFISYKIGNEIDTRLKVTDGQIHLVQKHGEGLKAFRSNIETNLDLELSSDELLKFVRLLQHMGSQIDGFTSPLQQYENYLFKIGDAEIKFYKQYNSKNAFYGFELEAEVNDEDEIRELASEYGLTPDTIDRSGEYWDEYDKTYNENSLELSDNELREIIERFVNIQ